MPEKKTLNLPHGVQVNFIANKQFKSVQVMISFLRGLTSHEELAKRTLLASLLESSCAKYPDQHAITLKLAELYGATFGVNTEVEGNISLLNFIYSFVAPEYLTDGQSLLDQSVAFLNEIIFHPQIENDRFNQEKFERQRQNLATYVKSMVDNKQSEALLAVQRLYFDNDVQQNTPYGTYADFQKLTNEELVAAYHQMVTEDQVQITVMGDFDPEDLKQTFTQMEFKNDHHIQLPKVCYHQELKEDVVTAVKVEKISQGKLDLIYQLPIDAHQGNRFYAAVVLNSMLGGSTQSLLFRNVRERESLAYYADSSYSALRSMILIQTGIQPENYDKAVALITRQIKILQNGDFPADLLDKIKTELINERKRMQDNPASNLEQAVLTQILDEPLDYQTQKEGIKQVTKDDVMQVAQLMKLQAKFFLKGE